jgi:hypothetical protein
MKTCNIVLTIIIFFYVGSSYAEDIVSPTKHLKSIWWDLMEGISSQCLEESIDYAPLGRDYRKSCEFQKKSTLVSIQSMVELAERRKFENMQSDYKGCSQYIANLVKMQCCISKVIWKGQYDSSLKYCHYNK